jgi:hypothetical protein
MWVHGVLGEGVFCIWEVLLQKARCCFLGAFLHECNHIHLYHHYIYIATSLFTLLFALLL